MTRESDIVHQNGIFWVLRRNGIYHVMRDGVTAASSESSYREPSLAIARCNYLAKGDYHQLEANRTNHHVR